MDNVLGQLSAELGLPQRQIESAVALIDDGNTIPFIARYRKEQTGGMDDDALRTLDDRLAYLRGMAKRREEIMAVIEEAGALDEKLRGQIERAKTLAELEDLYLPYRPKRKTRASVARERGLEPIAQVILEGKLPEGAVPGAKIEEIATLFVDADKEVESAEDALAGGCDIVAEIISENAALRKELRAFYARAAEIETTGKEGCEESVYKNYAEYREPARRMAGHRVLAVNRGEKEGLLKVAVLADRERAMRCVRKFYTASHPYDRTLVFCCEDAYDRLLHPAASRELRSNLTEAAVEGAITVFGANLKQLLLQPPIRGMRVMGFDPGYRTGCKIAVVDETGKVLDTGVVYPTPPQKKTEQAARTLLAMIQKHGVNLVAIGNGTASRESETFIADMIRDNKLDVAYVVVSEAGASVYSASKLGAAEFPQFDVSLRSAVSIARRLQDPLAELVKIDPQAIGVGQYQHDMPKTQLKHTLEGVVESCVNAVGVDLNTASAPLLTQVAGLSAAVAQNVVVFREENGAFGDRRTLKKVPKLGPKAFEQCAGFLRVPGAKNPLDTTAVHPESYTAAKKLLELCGYGLKDVSSGGLADLEDRIKQLGAGKLAEAVGVGEYTLRDIAGELVKPGRDPRDELPKPVLRKDVMEIEDLKPGMELTGTVRNVIDFGAFVDIGVHADGLVHISQLREGFVKNPLDVVSVGDVVTVWVLDVDVPRQRISLSMVGPK